MPGILSFMSARQPYANFHDVLTYSVRRYHTAYPDRLTVGQRRSSID